MACLLGRLSRASRVRLLSLLTLLCLNGCSGTPEVSGDDPLRGDTLVGRSSPAAAKTARRTAAPSKPTRKTSKTVDVAATDPVARTTEIKKPRKTKRNTSRARASAAKETTETLNTSKTAKKGETGKKEKTAKPRERTTAPPPPRKFAHSSKEAVRDYIRRLQGPPKDAETAFRELWEVPKAYIPDLIQEVENPSKSMVREVLILVFDREGFVSRDAKLSELVRRTRTDPKAWQSLMSARAGVYEYRVPGLGEIAYDQIGIGNARGGRAFKVRLRNLRGFRVGEVIRVALLNRFRSPRHPRGDGTGNLRGWWQAYYEMMKREL